MSSTGVNTCTVVIIITRTLVISAINADHVDTFNSFSGVLKTSTKLLNVFNSFNGIHDANHQGLDVCICTS